jgi:UDP-N-acetylmuramate--alanine ligase
MNVHFIGIGGIGVSALVKYYLKKGHKVTGSDLASSEIIDSLKKQGVKVYLGKHKAKNLSPKTELVIYSSAVKPDNPELLKAKALNLKAKSYPQALGELTERYFTIAVSGTHGKSTTVAMISAILIQAGLDPTVIIGTKLKEFGGGGEGSNCRVGKSKYLVIEADEWEAAFLNYWPKIIVLTNIEKEHLDYYKNLSHILKTYREYLSHLPKEGILIVNKDDQNIKKILRTKKTIFLAIAKNVTLFSLRQKEAKRIKKIIKIPGEHNISNALAALTVARALKIADKISFKALSEYKGAWRRFEILKAKPYTLISDYAHHPTEIKNTLLAAREKFKKRKFWAIFQPHQYQRTYYLFGDLLRAFDLADEIILTKIYEVAGREKSQISGKVSAKKLASSLKKRGKKTYYIDNFRKIPQFLKKKIESGDVILIMGAGNIYQIVDRF